MALQKGSLTTIVEENESEISNQNESNDNDEQNETNSGADADHISKDSITIHPQSFSIDTNASSYMCFKQILMSSSSIFNNPLYFFPNLEDPGIQEAFMLEPTPIIGDECQTYKEMCKEFEIFPIGRVCRSLFTGILNLKYYVPVEKQMKAICRTLEDNKFIQELNLQDNWLSVESCSYLMSLLQWNRTLTVLKLKECRIGPQGMAVLSESLGASFIEDLDLSFNSLGNEGIKNGIHGLGDNQKMKKLNLGHNELTEESAIYLNEILTSAGSLEELNLAWNCFNTVKDMNDYEAKNIFYLTEISSKEFSIILTGVGMKILCEGFKNAESLRWISLAWNGISKEQTIIPLARYVWRDLILQFLDLSNNLLKGNALKFIVRGISESKSLLHVKIGNNTFSPQQAFNSAQFLAKPRTRPLKLLDMENMVVQRRFLDLLQRIREQGKDVIHGTVLTNYEIYGPYIPKVLFERCRYLGMKPKKKRRRKDFGQFVLSLPKRSITSSEFQTILQAKKLKSLLDYDLVTAVQNQYMNQKTQKIDCSQLVDDYMLLYPYTELAPKKKRKAKRRKGKNKKVKTRDKQKEKSKPTVEEAPSVKVNVDKVFAEPSDVENIADTTIPQPLRTIASVNEELQESIEKNIITTEGRKKKMKTKDGKRGSSKSQSIDVPSVKEDIDSAFVASTAENDVENSNQPLKTGSQTDQSERPMQTDTSVEETVIVARSVTELEKRPSLAAKPSFSTKAKKRASFAVTTEHENETDTKIEKNPLRASDVFIIDEPES